MRLIKISIQLLVMRKNLVLLIIFYQPAHYYDGLPHHKHKKAADERQYQKNDTTPYDLIACGFTLQSINDLFYYHIVLPEPIFSFMHHRVYHIARKLWRQYSKIIGQNNEQNAEKKTVPVFPEEMIESSKVFHALAKLAD